MLVAIVKALIRESGPISVAQFMQLALYDPKYGYYTTREPFGRGGDFTTAPEISQTFGEIIGLWIADFWQRSGAAELRIVECGPGRGTLMADILRATKHVPEFHKQLSVTMVEISPRLKEMQQQKLRDYAFIKWQPEISSIPADRFTVMIGNEFLDALPIMQFILSPLPSSCGSTAGSSPNAPLDPAIKSQDDGMGSLGGDYGTTERRIGLDEHGDLCFLGGGDIREVCPAVEYIMKDAARLITPHGGACLFIDYGYEDAAPKEGTLQAVKAHHYHSIFEDIGEADLTALVDFAALAKAAKQSGLKPLPLLTQGLFLERSGIRIRLKALLEKATETQRKELETGVERLLSPDQMGTLFKVFCATDFIAITPHAFE